MAHIELKLIEKRSFNILGIGCKISKDWEKLPYKNIYWEKDDQFYNFLMIKEKDLYIIDVCIIKLVIKLFFKKKYFIYRLCIQHSRIILKIWMEIIGVG